MSFYPKPLRAIIFDWNGTLLNDLDLVYGSVRAIFAHYSLPPPSLATYREQITANFMEFYHRHGIPSSVSAHAINAIRSQYLNAHWNDADLHPGVENVLAVVRSKDLRCGIVSAEVANLLPRRLEQFGIAPFFEQIRGDAHDKTRELRIILSSMGIAPDEAMYVDDTYDGVRSALIAGVRAVGVTHGYHTSERVHSAQSNAAFVATSMFSVLRIIQREHKAR